MNSSSELEKSFNYDDKCDIDEFQEKESPHIPLCSKNANFIINLDENNSIKEKKKEKMIQRL